MNNIRMVYREGEKIYKDIDRQHKKESNLIKHQLKYVANKLLN